MLGFLGEYIGLTGARLDGAEMVACGLATYFVHSVVKLYLIPVNYLPIEAINSYAG